VYAGEDMDGTGFVITDVSLTEHSMLPSKLLDAEN
jgi:hypothetical protein